MFYISSTCSKQKRIGRAVQELVEHGFNNIELSGGTEYYAEYIDDLLDLKEKYKINYLVHNYFPPPEEPFVINLASLNDRVFEKSLSHLLKAIQLTRILGINKFGFHAGFYSDLSINDLGKKVVLSDSWERQKVFQRFCEGYNFIKQASNGISLYVENNAYSKINFDLYGVDSPFMLTSPEEYIELKNKIDFTLLLDIGHLYVSSLSLCFDFDSCLDQLSLETDYIHLSNNNGLFDENRGFTSNSNLFKKLRNAHLENKIITLEVYEGIDVLKASIQRIATEVLR